MNRVGVVGFFHVLLLATAVSGQTFGDCLNDCLMDCLQGPSASPVPTSAPTFTPTPTLSPVSSPPPLTPSGDEESPPPPPPPPQYDDNDGSPPDIPEQPTTPPTPPIEPYTMTRSFPLGSCSPITNPLPYELSLIDNKPGKLCFQVNLSANYTERCKAKQIMSACKVMLTKWAKIVFWYRQTNQCGFKFTQEKRHLDKFIWYLVPWNTQKGVVNAGTWGIYPVNKTDAFAAGALSLFKYRYSGDRTSVEVSISREAPFVRATDESAAGYLVCLKYDVGEVDLPFCISNNAGVVRYAFVNPSINYCSTGSLLV